MRACFAIALDIQMKHGSVKASVFVDNFVKMISDAKSFIWNFFGNLVNKADGTVIDSTACTVITAYKVAK